MKMPDNKNNNPYTQTVILPNNGMLILRDKVTYSIIPAKTKKLTINPYIEFRKSVRSGCIE